MKTLLNVKADKDVKEQAQRLAEELGLSLSAVVNAQLKQFVRDKEVYFSSAPKMTPALEAIIEEAERDLRGTRNLSPMFRSARDMDRYLDAA